eukprot:TRINITY_DN7441_c0_g1_i1.p1 TRINITY_DN7441_c0_g1~~TRINITY_DN7441_c0_g1_i1.p1  ORF type:complete len:106 (-),score=11.15 TRINITY_DN7441_c0_g1_i1:114-431(-)
MYTEIKPRNRFRTITAPYYRGADGVIAMYDITDRNSFAHVNKWLQEVDKFIGKKDNVVRMIIGSKLDLEHSRKIQTQEGADLAKSIGIHPHDFFFLRSNPTNQLA